MQPASSACPVPDTGCLRSDSATTTSSGKKSRPRRTMSSRCRARLPSAQRMGTTAWSRTGSRRRLIYCLRCICRRVWRGRGWRLIRFIRGVCLLFSSATSRHQPYHELRVANHWSYKQPSIPNSAVNKAQKSKTSSTKWNCFGSLWTRAVRRH